ncbi:MAG: dinitrogenase iron-molybdenum cofactor biosynthesis protein [Bacteroidetes bacterium HGW-Bacteroidetes-19]|nr:MAG: dinitrogenase iron-molybdenum cofactor biosynthesis protein [Bacteroidetes bacterium HGW-Bacteroidetes-19]
MKIAVPVTGSNQIDSHFGHCEFYNVYTVSENKEVSEVKRIASTQGCGCKSNIANTLAADGVDVMLAGGIGEGAINVLNFSGISVVRGCSGDATEVLQQYLLGQISDSGSTCQEHGSHDHKCNH